MKTIKLLLASLLLTSCFEKVNYPNYSLIQVNYVPDSLKVKHREWIKETVRASNQHLSAGDYEDVDQTIIQATWTADELFQVSAIGLRKSINDNRWDDLELTPNEMTPKEKKILDSLTNN